MKKWLYLVFTTLFFFSCSEIDDNIPDNNDEDNNGDKDNIENENDMPVLNQFQYLQPIITQYFIDNKSEIWLLFLIAHSKR